MRIPWVETGVLPGRQPMTISTAVPRVPITVLNVRVYRCFFEASPQFNSELPDSDILTIFERVNRLWYAAGIQWRLQAIVAHRGNGEQLVEINANSGRLDLRVALLDFAPKIPDVISSRLWSVCLMRQLPIRASGVYLPEAKTVFGAEFSPAGQLNAAVLAHELGHSLGLGHVQAPENLMNPDALKKIHRRVEEGNERESNAIPQVLSEEQIRQCAQQVRSGPYSNQARSTGAR